MECRILKNKDCIITQNYNNDHPAIDVVGNNNMLDYIIAHSDGIVEEVQDGYSNIKGSTGVIAYGNYIKINHQNEYHTLYAHMQSGLSLTKNQKVKKGQIMGYMSDSGNSYGKHLHFEVWYKNKKINPTEYLNKSFINNDLSDGKVTLKYKIGDIININGVYISSTSKEKLRQ